MKSSLKINQPESLTEMVFNRLYQAIVDGSFSLGENISEERLVEALGVSRTPVRDALSQLQLMGLVNVRSKRGTFVFEPTEQDVIDICEFRFMLETNTVRMALKRDRVGFLKAMDDCLEEMSRALASNDVIAYGRSDTRFHQSFTDWSGNPYIQNSYRLAAGRIAALRTILTGSLHERHRESLDEHRLMVGMMVSNDLTGLDSLFRAHIDRTLSVYLDALRCGKIGRSVDKKIEVTL